MKTKALISFTVTAKLICVFVFAYAKSRVFHDEAHFCICSMQWPGLNYTCTTGKNRNDVTIKALTYWLVTLLLGRGSHSLVHSTCRKYLKWLLTTNFEIFNWCSGLKSLSWFCAWCDVKDLHLKITWGFPIARGHHS